MELENRCIECVLENDCPGYYDGCFDVVNSPTGVKLRSIEEIHNKLLELAEEFEEAEKSDCDIGGMDRASAAIEILNWVLGK